MSGKGRVRSLTDVEGVAGGSDSRIEQWLHVYMIITKGDLLQDLFGWKLDLPVDGHATEAAIHRKQRREGSIQQQLSPRFGFLSINSR